MSCSGQKNWADITDDDYSENEENENVDEEFLK